MSSIVLQNQNITGLKVPTKNSDATNKEYVDSKVKNITVDINNAKLHCHLFDDVTNFKQRPLYTVTEPLPNNYLVTGVFDGMGACLKNSNTVNLYVSNELSLSKEFSGHTNSTYKYTINGIDLYGGRITRFELDRETKNVKLANLAYTDIIAPDGTSLSNANKDTIFAVSKKLIDNGESTMYGFERLCSGHLVEPGFWGSGKGVVNKMYVTGEEVVAANFFNIDSPGGRIVALDVATNKLYCLPGLPRFPFENMVDIDCGTEFVGFALGGEHAPASNSSRNSMAFRAGSPDDLLMAQLPADFKGSTGTASINIFGSRLPTVEGNVPAQTVNGPFNYYRFGGLLCIYIGRKVVGSSDFVERNGFKTGFVYVFSADGKTCTPNYTDYPNLTGKFVKLNLSSDATYQELMLKAQQANAYLFNRFEDVSVNLNNPSEFAITVTNNNTTEKVTLLSDLSNLTDYPLEISAKIDRIGGNPTSSLSDVIRPDNLEWTKDNKLWITEDGASKVGKTNYKAANRIGYYDMSLPIPQQVNWIANAISYSPYPAGTIDVLITNDLPEPSGIIDVSNMFAKNSDGSFKLSLGYTGQQARDALDGSTLIYNVEDHTQWKGDIKSLGLGEGSQLILLENLTNI